MFCFPSNIKVYLAVGTTDMRKSINGLSVLVSECHGRFENVINLPV